MRKKTGIKKPTLRVVNISGAKGARNIVLKNEGEEVKIVGMFHVKSGEKKEISVKIIHKAMRTKAETLMKGVVEGSGQLKIEGAIIIEPTAQQSQSFLRENILLLDTQSRAEAIPNLEISADDVKCSHAATISNIPAEQLFYLQSRGLSKEKAKELIVSGFLAEVATK